MGLLDRLFGNRHPALQWQAAPDLQIALEMSVPALCGIRFGDHADRVARLGPPDEVIGKEGECESFIYTRLGLQIDASERSVDSWGVYFEPAEYQAQMAAFKGFVSDRDQALSLSPATTLRDFKKHFGEPYWEDVDEVENLLFYEFGQIEWQVEFKQERLTVITMATPPLLSDAGQRAAYQVSKPWPPASDK